MKEKKPQSRPSSKQVGKNDDRRLTFCFRYLDEDRCGKLTEWEGCGLLSALVARLRDIAQDDLYSANKNGYISFYDQIPENCKIEIPENTLSDIEKETKKDAFWGTVRKIDVKNKARVVGVLADSVFHILYLDKNHEFFP